MTKFRLLSVLCIILMSGTAFGSLAKCRQPNIIGTVCADGRPLAGVQVSDGQTIVCTDAHGHYRMPSNKKEGTVFITTPSGYIAESVDNYQPAFWHELRHDINNTDTIDFFLKSENQSDFAIIFTTDTHLTNDTTKDDLLTYERLVMPRIREVASEYGKKHRPVYSINLGDLSHELFWYDLGMTLDKVVDYVVKTGYPTLTYNISGNHDNDGAVITPDVDHNAAWLYRKTLGPAQYAINIGDTHWVMLDNIIYRNIPGKGKKAKGIKGDRSYDIGFTPRQLEWLKKDLQTVSDSMHVFICCHAPLLFPKNEAGLLITDHAQMDTLDRILSRFPHVTVFSGHAHKNLYQTNPKYPRFTQFVFGATSGAMWNTSKHYQTICEDGSAAGIWVADFDHLQEPRYRYHTYQPGNPMFRAYDLNAVGRYYRDNADVQYQLKLYPGRIDYSNPAYADMIMVNFWCDRDDLSLTILENGHPLPVKKEITFEDPLYNISYYVPLIRSTGTYRKSFDNIKNHNMYVAKASDSTSSVEIRVTDKNGLILYQELMIRPKKFDIQAE